MAFVVNNLVWFKQAGQTPYVKGDAANAALPAGDMLGGRGKPDVSRYSAAGSGLSDQQGVPTFPFSAMPAALSSSDASSGTTDGEDLGVHAGDNPLAPIDVDTDGIFDGPTSDNLFNPGLLGGSRIDEGRVEDAVRVNTIRDINPNEPSGRSAGSGAAKASGDAINVGGAQEYRSEVIDLQTASKKVGIRLPSSLEAAGRVIQVVVVQTAGISPEGTKVRPGQQMYWVNWGCSTPSNPRRTRWYNKFRVQLHAESELVAA